MRNSYLYRKLVAVSKDEMCKLVPGFRIWFKHRSFLSTVGAIALTLITSILSGVDAQELRPVASAFTVRVDTPGEGDGSGTIIAREGSTYYVLTSWHVVDESEEYAVRTYDSRTYGVIPNSVQRLPGYDLAVLRFSSLNNYELAIL